MYSPENIPNSVDKPDKSIFDINSEEKKKIRKELLEMRKNKLERDPHLKYLRAKDIKNLSARESALIKKSFEIGSMADEEFDAFMDAFEEHRREVREYMQEKRVEARERGEVFEPNNDPRANISAIITNKVNNKVLEDAAREDDFKKAA